MVAFFILAAAGLWLHLWRQQQEASPKSMPAPSRWESVGAHNVPCYRIKTPTGWVVSTGQRGGVTFVPDPEHAWIK